jgi:hypothetical protein
VAICELLSAAVNPRTTEPVIVEETEGGVDGEVDDFELAMRLQQEEHRQHILALAGFGESYHGSLTNGNGLVALEGVAADSWISR